MDAPAHKMIDPFFFCFRQIGFSVIQLHVCMGLFQYLRWKNRDLVLFSAFLFHGFCHSSVFKPRHISGKLLHIAFQSFLIQLFREIILPGIFCKLLYADRKYLFQIPVNSFKGRVHQPVIELIHKPDQVHGVLCTGCACHCVRKLLKLFFRPVGAALQPSS